jgi:hypothetical protein
MKEELTTKQTERQDLVDNAIQALLEHLTGKQIEWNIEIISNIREEIQDQIVNRLELMTEMEFYPYLRWPND